MRLSTKWLATSNNDRRDPEHPVPPAVEGYPRERAQLPEIGHGLTGRGWSCTRMTLPQRRLLKRLLSQRPRPKRTSVQTSERERSVGALLWYRFVQYVCATLTLVILRWRATGQHNMPTSGGVLLVSNHLSFLDVFLLGIPLRRPLNYVARSTLFVPGLGALIRSVGGFLHPPSRWIGNSTDRISAPRCPARTGGQRTPHGRHQETSRR